MTARAKPELVSTRQKRQGGSTITMQVARNFFLTPEKTYERKLKEIVLAVVIERELSKDEILELYLNKIFLGHRAYGVGAAAQVYYGATLDELTLPEAAMIAGLPKAPSRTNPISNPQAAVERRNYVLGRMLKLGYIDDAAYATARAAPNTAEWHGQAVESEASHVAEMVREKLVEEYGDLAYTAGYRVITTLDSRLQEAATAAVQGALIDYRIALFKVPMRWRTEIAEWSPDERFVDRQISGPYKLWHHAHEFEEVPEGTRMRDIVTYEPPLGPLGTLARALFVRRVLDRIFDYRSEEIARIFG